MEIIKEDYRFKAKNILNDTSKMVAYALSFDFYKDMSKITDINDFSKIMNSIGCEEKQKIENGIIYLTQKRKKDDLKKYEVIFLEKYHQYLNYILEKDVREYFNNVYCSYLYSKEYGRLSLIDNYKNIKFINGKLVADIDSILVNMNNKIMNKVRKNEEIDYNDKMFLEENFLFKAFHSVVYKENNGENDLMYDIVDYFNKYPIKDLSTPRNMQLSILYVLSNEMIKMPSNSAIEFSTEYTYSTISKTNILGFYTNILNGVPMIRVNGLDVYDLRTETEFLEKLFTMFHELGHFRQEIEKFNDELKNVIEMEKYLIKYDSLFYKKYHDSFYLELDADNYAVTQIIQSYGTQYPEIVTDIVAKELNRKRIDWSVFYLMELEEYEKVMLQRDAKNLNI